MTSIDLPTAEQVLLVNERICKREGNPHHCYGIGKVESALHSAFYPGVYPFAHGGIAKVAGALCFYLVNAHAFVDGNKRTGALIAITFMNENGWTLRYPKETSSTSNALADIIESCAAGKVSKDEIILWFDQHKKKK